MSNIKSEFEKLFNSQRSYRSSDKEAFIRGCEAAFKHQQSKVDELTKQRDSFIKAYEIEMDKSVDLQKRVDAVKQLIEEYRDPPTEDKTFKHALSIVAYELEQALKGGSDEAK